MILHFVEAALLINTLVFIICLHLSLNSVLRITAYIKQGIILTLLYSGPILYLDLCMLYEIFRILH